MVEEIEVSERLQSTATVDTELSLRHLEAELAQIDVLLRRQVRRWQLANQETSDTFRGLYVSDAEVGASLDRPMATNWGTTVTLEPADERYFANALRQAALQSHALAETARRQGHTVPLAHLAKVFNLDAFDLKVALVCLAPALDLRYERVYGYLQDDVTKRRPSVNLVLDLLCEPGRDRLQWLARFNDKAPLFRHELLHFVAEPGAVKPPLLAQALAVDAAVISWLLGSYAPHPELRPYAVLLAAPTAQDGTLPIEPERRMSLLPCLAGGIETPLVVFHGPDELAQETVAAWLAFERRQPLLQVDLAAATEAGVSPGRGVHLALRDATLTGAVLYLTGWAKVLEASASSSEALAALYAFPGLAIVAGSKAWQPQGIERKRRVLTMEFPVPSFVERRELWRRLIQTPTRAASSLETQEDAIDLSAVAGQFTLTSTQIRDAMATARDTAFQRGTPLCGDDLLSAARAHSSPHLSSLARKITPRYTWQDIVLPNDQAAQLREIVAAVRGRPVVLEEWGLGRKLVSSQGVAVLFAGPPGTGKTMAAEIIAGELGLDLFKIDLSTVVSKYIGETEKNLERIFTEAASSNAILFFDEADALFGKRSEVRDSHDRYANIEISYLLQRMETYHGVTMLATNLRANLDEAFTRRLQFAVDFPSPEEADRLRIWQTLFPAEVPRAPELDFQMLARRFKLAGGSIRNVIVSAAYAAASNGNTVTMEHLMHGTRRELQKMGRLISEQEFTGS